MPCHKRIALFGRFFQGKGGLIVLIIGIVVGHLTGLALGGSVGELPLTVIAGLLVTAAAVRNMIMVRGPRSGTGRLTHTALGDCLLGKRLASIEVARLSEVSAPAWLGALAGLTRRSCWRC